MKKLLVLGLLVIGASAQALEPKDVFGSIFDIIIGEINKDKPKPGKPIPPPNNGNDGVILKDSGDKLVLGRLKINDSKTINTVRFPACVNNGMGNKRVSRVRFYTNESDVYVNSVTITFQNDESKTFNLGQTYADGDASGWLVFRGTNNGRCIKKITVDAELDQTWNNGWGNGAPGNHGPGNPGGWISNNGPGGNWNGKPGLGGNGNGGNWNNGPGNGGPGGPGGWNGNNGPGNGNGGWNGNNGGNNNSNDRAILSFVGQKI